MKLNKIELAECKRDLEKEMLSYMKSDALATYRIFVNGNDEISFWVSDLVLDNEQVMTVSKDMFYKVFDVVICNKIFSELFARFYHDEHIAGGVIDHV